MTGLDGLADGLRGGFPVAGSAASRHGGSAPPRLIAAADAEHLSAPSTRSRRSRARSW
jgi:hypothetical protein